MTDETPYYSLGITGYAKAVNIYRSRGWVSVIPLPENKKSPPPRGWTGSGTPYPDDAQYGKWVQENPKGNVGLRMAPGVVGIDVDSYGNKPGAASLFELVGECGPLPSTWISTGRKRLGDAMSGIRFYRVGEDVKFKGNPKPGIEIIQHHHRYACVWPSWNPQADAYYEWWGPDGRESDPPWVQQLPLLPPEWVEALKATTEDEKKGVGYEGDGSGDLGGVSAYITLTEKYIERVRQGASCHDTSVALANQLRDNRCGLEDAIRIYARIYFDNTRDFTDREEYSYLEVCKAFEWVFQHEPREPMGKFKTEHHAEVFPSPGKPMEVARKLLELWRTGGECTARRWRETWMTWSDILGWREIGDEELRELVYTVLEHAYFAKIDPDTGEEKLEEWNPNAAKVNNVVDALKAAALLSNDIDDPAWLDGRRDPMASEMVACKNGLLHVNNRTLIPPDPRFFSRTVLALDYDVRAPVPVEWLKFLTSLWPNDPAAINTLQEIFGYIVSGRTDLQKIMLILGPPRAGKGTIARILTELVGQRNIASPTLMSLGSHFGLQPLIGKSLAIIGDARIDGKGSKEIVSKLLGVSGEDSISIDRKNRSYWTGRLNTRFLILTNEIPNLRDAGGALASRFVPLYLTESWLGREDSDLERRLRLELSGIMNWALDGLDRVKASGGISVPASSDDVVRMIHDTTSPVALFLEERCCLDPTVKVRTRELYDAWTMWAVGSGFQPGSVISFGRDLMAIDSSLVKKRVMVEGESEYYYFGIKLAARV